MSRCIRPQSSRQQGENVLPNIKKLSLWIFIFYAGFGYLAASISNGMRGANGPALVAFFIISLLALDLFLIKRYFILPQVNIINLVSVLPFYFFSIARPLWITCPAPVSAIIALVAFSLVTLVPFAVMAYLIRRALIRLRLLTAEDPR